MKSLKIWKNFKNNEIVIYAIALMLVTAGYFNYTTNVGETSLETASETSQNISENDTIENSVAEEASIGDARLVSNNEVIEKEDIDVPMSTNVANIEVENSEEDYFVSSKLERDTNYASTISTYTKILEDASISEVQKSIAMQEITKINKTKSAIAVCENLLSTKGFTNCVVFVNQDSVNVVIKTDSKLTTDKVAQIQNVVSRELNVKIENIHITEKK